MDLSIIVPCYNEVDNLVADCLADLHLCASRTAVQHLAAEGIVGSVHWVGDVMLDAFLQSRSVARRSHILSRLELRPGTFALVTVHRAANTDDANRLEGIVTALNGYGQGQAALWAFALARSVAHTRQGNPAWANQERDGGLGIRAADMFKGWIDLDRIHILQADEQQRLCSSPGKCSGYISA